MGFFSKPKWRPRRAEDVLFSAGVFCVRLGVFFRVGPTGYLGRRPPACRLGCPTAQHLGGNGSGYNGTKSEMRCFFRQDSGLQPLKGVAPRGDYTVCCRGD